MNATPAAAIFLFALLTSKAAAAFCFAEAAERYRVPEYLLVAIAKHESNMDPLATNTNKGKNPSVDYGLMQVNSGWLPTLKRYGITKEDLLNKPCTNVYVGAWILSKNIQKHGMTWKAVGAYNAISPHKQEKYITHIWRHVNQQHQHQHRTHRKLADRQGKRGLIRVSGAENQKRKDS